MTGPAGDATVPEAAGAESALLAARQAAGPQWPWGLTETGLEPPPEAEP